MGGGDLNSKKSWHPNTMKNQERVWKAEQAAAEEKKRIMELQNERAAERDRAELNDLAKRSAGSSNNDDRLHWMYDKPDKKGQAEDYLLGKTIEKNYDQPEKSDGVIPAVARRVVGSSMMTSAEDSQVDLVRKMREDPLLLVKERERAARAALLNNPLHRKRIAELLRKEQEQLKGSKVKKPKKKEKDLDSMLAAKLNALGGEKGVDVAALLASDDSSSDVASSEDEENTKKTIKKKSDKKFKKSKKSRKKKKHSGTDTSNDDAGSQKLREGDRRQDYLDKHQLKKSRYHRSDSSDSDINFKNRVGKKDMFEEKRYKSDYQRNRDKRSESPKFFKDFRDTRKHQESFVQRKYKDEKESRKRRSESNEDREAYSKRNKQDVSGHNEHDRFWSQQKKRTVSDDSDRETNKNRKTRDFSAERRKINSLQDTRKWRGVNSESTNKRCRNEGSKYIQEGKRKHRSVSQDSDKGIKNNRSRRDSYEDRKYKEDKRKQRSLSYDSGNESRHKRGRRESSEDRKQKDKRKQRSLSYDSGKETRHKKVRREDSEDQKHKENKRKQTNMSHDSGKGVKNKKDRFVEKQKYEQCSRRRDSSGDKGGAIDGTPEKNRERNENEKPGRSKHTGLSAEEKAARLLDMAAAGAEREEQRGRRVAAQRAAARAEDSAPPAVRAGAHARALPASLEARIHSNRHYIQRNQSHMNENFARR